MIATNHATGIVAADPAYTMPIGAELRFEPCSVTHQSQANAVWLKDWESFEGILLSLMFANKQSLGVEGSAVLVAPGVAVCARHAIEPRLNAVLNEGAVIVCMGIASHGVQIWRLAKVTLVPQSDLAILGLAYASELPPRNLFRQATITTRFPKVGESLLICGFKPEGQVQASSIDSEGKRVSVFANVIMCNGEIAETFPVGRDRLMLPSPSVQVNCPSWGGMSGGPVFDHQGMLIGLLSTSIRDDKGPSFVSLLWPALGCAFEGGWPAAAFLEKRTLWEMDPRTCFIDDRAAIEVVTGPDGTYSMRYRI